MGTRRELSQIDTIVIHCADVPNGRANTIEDIDQWHGERKPPFNRDLALAPDWQPHLKHVGYHFVIEVDGAVRPGRPIQETGAHVAGHNGHTIGICLVGRDQYTPAQWDALRVLVKSIDHPHNSLAGLSISRICGHRDLFIGKACPGFDVATWVANDYQPDQAHILEAA